MKLYFYEWKKLFLKKNFLIVFIGLLILNIGVIGYNYKNNYLDKQLTYAQKYYSQKFSGPITKQNVENVKQEINLVTNQTQAHYYSGGQEGDLLILNDIYNDMQSRYEYKTRNQEYLHMLLDNIDYFHKNHQINEEAYNQMLYDHFTNRQVTTYDYLIPWENLLDYPSTPIFIGLTLLLGIMIMVSVEKDNGMQTIVETCKNGRGKIRRIKYGQIISLSISTVLVFSLVECMTFWSLYGISGFNEPIYAIEEFAKCPINCTILQFYLFSILFRIITFTFMSLLFLTLSQYIKNYLVSIITGLLIIGFLLIMSQMNIINPMMLLQGKNLFLNVESISIGNYYFFKYQGMIMISIIGIVVLSVLYIKKHRRCYL